MNDYKITVKQVAEDYGYDDISEFVQEMCQDSVVPACCSDGCEVEPDGICEHGCKSVLLSLNLI